MNTIELDLLAFNFAEIIEHDTSAGNERGIFIPFRPNNIYFSWRKHKAATYLNIIPAERNMDGMTHDITIRWSKDNNIKMQKKYGKTRGTVVGHIIDNDLKYKPANIEDVLK